MSYLVADCLKVEGVLEVDYCEAAVEDDGVLEAYGVLEADFGNSAGVGIEVEDVHEDEVDDEDENRVEVETGFEVETVEAEVGVEV